MFWKYWRSVYIHLEVCQNWQIQTNTYKYATILMGILLDSSPSSILCARSNHNKVFRQTTGWDTRTCERMHVCSILLWSYGTLFCLQIFFSTFCCWHLVKLKVCVTTNNLCFWYFSLIQVKCKHKSFWLYNIISQQICFICWIYLTYTSWMKYSFFKTNEE